jgi:carbamate kinase
MRLVVALGGNALLRRGQALTADNQRVNARLACKSLAPLALEHELVVSHGNGPQVGLLALQASAYTEVDPYPLDLLGAETDGMIGYLIQQELGNELPFEKRIATLLTLIEVDGADPAFKDPTKPIGPTYTEADSVRLADENGWTFKPDGGSFRRVVASPAPQRIFGTEPIEWLLARGAVVICAGGGGIPVMYTKRSCACRTEACRGRGRDRQGSGERAACRRSPCRSTLDRHGRRRRLRRLGHAGSASDPESNA